MTTPRGAGQTRKTRTRETPAAEIRVSPRQIVGGPVPRKTPLEPAEDEANPFADGLVSATQTELRNHGALETMLGQQVLIIARGMARGQGSELATLSKEHSRLMANIAAGKTVADDPVADADESVRRKLARAAQA